MKEIKVSIILPIYNVEKYLDRCMDSLLNQTLKDIEIIMVDDGSPDNCPQMCDEYAKKDERVKVIHKKNGGLGYARNSGLEIATGEYVAFVDSDDYVELDAYEKMYTSVKQYESDAVFTGFKIELVPGVWDNVEVEGQKLVLSKEKTFEYALDMIANLPIKKKEREHYMSVWHSLYKKSIIDVHNLKFVSERDYGCEDLPFQIDFLSKSNSMVILPFVSYYYCLNDTSLTATFSQDKFERYVRLRTLLINKLGNDVDVMLRINRFIIGYGRAQMTNLMASNEKRKYAVLQNMISHPVWREVSAEYKTKYLSLPNAIMYWLTVHKLCSVLWVYSKLFLFVKRALKKRT